MRSWVIGLVAIVGCGVNDAPQPAPDDREATLAAAARAYYGAAADRHGVSMTELAARTTMRETPTFDSSQRLCYRYLERVDWAFIQHDDCFSTTALGRLEQFRFGPSFARPVKLTVTDKADLLVRLARANREDGRDSVELHAAEVGGRVRMTSAFEIDLPGGGAISLADGKVSEGTDWSGKLDDD